MAFIAKLKQNPLLACGLWIALCFTLASCAYLSWLYRLLALTGAAAADWLTMVAGYLIQAAGASMVALHLRRQSARDRRRLFALSVLLLAASSVPALLSSIPAAAIISGLIMNLACGLVSGFYLFALCARCPSRPALCFGGGYALSTFAVFLLSLVGRGGFLQSRWALPVCLLLSALCAGAVYLIPLLNDPEAPAAPSPEVPRSLSTGSVSLALVVVLLMSLVKNLGFSFPSSDIQTGMRPELSRLFYALGLAAAGFIHDKSRKNGAVCTVAALALPFILLSVSGEPVSTAIFWGLDYLLYGFFSVYRVVLLVDIAASARKWHLSLLGLAVGRVGDAAGTALCLVLTAHKTALVALTAALFMITVILFFRLYQRLYEPEVLRQKSEREVFETFSAQHDLSAREREVMRLLIAEKSNGEIAEALFVSESTVKYHVHNLLKKTGCRSRMDLIGKYASALYPGQEPG